MFFFVELKLMPIQFDVTGIFHDALLKRARKIMAKR